MMAAVVQKTKHTKLRKAGKRWGSHALMGALPGIMAVLKEQGRLRVNACKTSLDF